MRKYLLWVTSLSYLLTGCVTQPVGPQPGDEPDVWRLLGKIAIRAESKSRVLSIDWRHTGNHSVIELSGPLGISVAHIEALGDELTVTTNGGVSHQRRNLSMVLVEDTRVTLPWRDLAYWVRGMTASGKPIDPGGHVSGPWEVKILKQDESGPRLILFRHKLVTLKLQIREWR